MKYQIKNNLGKTEFKGGERDFIEFVRKQIKKNNNSVDYSTISLSDAIEYIDDYCVDLYLEYQFIIGFHNGMWKEFYTCSFANAQTNCWYSIYAENKEIALEKVKAKFLEDKKIQWDISEKDIKNFLDNYGKEHFEMPLDALEIFMCDHISIIYEGVGYFISKCIIDCDDDIYNFLNTYYHE